MELTILFDVIVVGAGVVGAAIARELSRFELEVCVLERANDVACGTSKANSGIVHAGYDAKVGTKKARFNLAGSKMFERLSRELDFPFKRNGAMVLAFDESQVESLSELLERGRQNGVSGLEILSGDEVRKREPNVSSEVVAALFAPTSGIVGPYEMTIAYFENAVANGVKFHFEKEVVSVVKTEGGFAVGCADGSNFEARAVVNAAGLHSDELNNMVGAKKLKILPRRGEYCLFDKSSGTVVGTTLFQTPSKMGKGILVTPTTHGNLLIGPNAEEIEGKAEIETTFAGLNDIFEKAQCSVPNISRRDIITQFAGLRAHGQNDDFVVGESRCKGFFNAACIESPGLTSAPAIGVYLAKLIAKKLTATKRKDFVGKRKGILKFSEQSPSQKKAAIKKDPLFGRIVCRCEEVTEGEIVQAVKRGAKDLDGVKRRTRAGMGRCQSGFCSPRILEIIARERQIPLSAVTKNGGSGNILIAPNKEVTK